MAEGFMEADQRLMPLISSANIACGFHAGNSLMMEQTIRLAKNHQVSIGAHPGYPDKKGFGRNNMRLPADELTAMIKYQLAAITGLAKSLDIKVGYVKLHGALYHQAGREEMVALSCLKAVNAIDPELKLVGQYGSVLDEVCSLKGHLFVAEAFADRRYEHSGQLRSRKLPEAVISDPLEACAQVMSIINKRAVKTWDGGTTAVTAQTICIHGDNPAAAEILHAIDTELKANGIITKPFS